MCQLTVVIDSLNSVISSCFYANSSCFVFMEIAPEIWKFCKVACVLFSIHLVMEWFCNGCGCLEWWLGIRRAQFRCMRMGFENEKEGKLWGEDQLLWSSKPSFRRLVGHLVVNRGLDYNSRMQEKLGETPRSL
ncbi:hypothetical protein AAC387_Pa07g0022 [Persea americana]